MTQAPPPPPLALLDLATDLLARVVARCDTPADIARVAAVSRIFHSSLAEEGIRLRARERGYELAEPPAGDSCDLCWLCFAAMQRESNPPMRVASSMQHSVFIDGEGRLASCGGAGDTKLLGHDPWRGLGLFEGREAGGRPTRLPSQLGGARAESVSVGSCFSLALAADGSVWSWGRGQGGGGWLGHAGGHYQQRPKKIEALAGQRVVAISAGSFSSLALTTDGAVWSWGAGGGMFSSCSLGHSDRHDHHLPTKIEALAGQRVVAISAGDYHSLALTMDGAIWSWGEGRDGALGHGNEQNQQLPKKVEALSGRRVIAVSAGGGCSFALTTGGVVWSWGSGLLGTLGHGNTEKQLLPKRIDAFAGQRVIAVSADRHTFAITADGSAWSWGPNNLGRLGHGDTQSRSLPNKIEALAGQRVVSVVASGCHGFALTADGAFFSWGHHGGGGESILGHGYPFVMGQGVEDQLLPKKIDLWVGERPDSTGPSEDGDESNGEYSGSDSGYLS